MLVEAAMRSNSVFSVDGHWDHGSTLSIEYMDFFGRYHLGE